MSKKDLSKTENMWKKYRWKYLWLQFLNSWPSFLIAIIATLGTGEFISWKLSQSIKASQEISVEIRDSLQQVLTQTNSQNQTVTVGNNNQIKQKEEGSVSGYTTTSTNMADFDSILWDFSNANKNHTNDGYYCPDGVSFPSWFVWTHKKFLIEDEVQIRFKLKDKTENMKPPTLFISYGEDTDVFYRVNILDGDLNTIRVYAEKGEYKESDRSKNTPNLDNEFLIVLKPSAPSRNQSKITLNPELSFKLESNEMYPFVPNKIFIFGTPLVNIDKQGEGKQFGIGVSDGDCFKILSSNLQ